MLAPAVVLEVNKLRIAVIAHLKHSISEPFAGGLEKHTFVLAEGLRRRGHGVTVFASTRSDPTIGLEAICEETALHETGVEEASDVVFFREHHAYLRLMLELRRRQFDVVHNNSLHYLPVSMADAIAAPMLTTLHTPPFCWLESGVRLASRAARYTAVSQATARLWSAIAPGAQVVPNGVDLRTFAFTIIPDRERYLVWYGRIVPEKGLEMAIDAASMLGIPLKIAGPISDKPYYETEIRPRLSDLVTYLGHLPQKALAALVGKASAALVTPRWEEPYGLVVAEALASGTPVAAFRRGGVVEILDADCGVLAEPDDVAGLANAARAALALDRGACRRRAEAVCDAERMLDAYEDIYREMSPGAREGPGSDPRDASESDAAAFAPA